MQTVTEFQLQAPYLLDRASYQLLGRPWRISVRCVVFEEGPLELKCQVAIQRGMEGGANELPKRDQTLLVGGSIEEKV